MMLTAKMFALLTILLLGLAALGRTTRQHADIYFHGTYFVVARIHVKILQAVVSACFGLIYFASARWLSHPLNDSVGLAQFVLVTLGLVVVSLAMNPLNAEAARAGLPEATPHLWPYLAFRAGAVSFLLGCGVFVVNLIWTALQISRLR